MQNEWASCMRVLSQSNNNCQRHTKLHFSAMFPKACSVSYKKDDFSG